MRNPKLRIVTRPTSPSPSLTRGVPSLSPHIWAEGQMLRILPLMTILSIAEFASHTPGRWRLLERTANGTRKCRVRVDTTKHPARQISQLVGEIFAADSLQVQRRANGGAIHDCGRWEGCPGSRFVSSILFLVSFRPTGPSFGRPEDRLRPASMAPMGPGLPPGGLQAAQIDVPNIWCVAITGAALPCVTPVGVDSLGSRS